jgi:hypothetical protein
MPVSTPTTRPPVAAFQRPDRTPPFESSTGSSSRFARPRVQQELLLPPLRQGLSVNRQLVRGLDEPKVEGERVPPFRMRRHGPVDRNAARPEDREAPLQPLAARRGRTREDQFHPRLRLGNPCWRIVGVTLTYTSPRTCSSFCPGGWQLVSSSCQSPRAFKSLPVV